MKKMLMIVDPQIDFINGTLPVPGAATAMDALAGYVREHGDEYASLVVTGDSHPANHCSFSTQGGPWPAHCVEGTEGVRIWPALEESLIQAGAVRLRKGNNAASEEYSIFANEESKEKLARIIESENIGHIDICGLAGDICVAQSMADGRAIYGDGFFTLLPQFSPTIG